CRSVARAPGGAMRSTRKAHAIGASAKVTYGSRHEPASASVPASSGAAKNARWPAVVWVPSATPRRANGKVSAMSAEAGAWYVPLAMPMTMSPTRSAQYEPERPIATLERPMRTRPPTMTRRAPTRSASTPRGAFVSPDAIGRRPQLGERDRIGCRHVLERHRRRLAQQGAHLRPEALRVALAVLPELLCGAQPAR